MKYGPVLTFSYFSMGDHCDQYSSYSLNLVTFSSRMLIVNLHQDTIIKYLKMKNLRNNILYDIVMTRSLEVESCFTQTGMIVFL